MSQPATLNTTKSILTHNNNFVEQKQSLQPQPNENSDSSSEADEPPKLFGQVCSIDGVNHLTIHDGNLLSSSASLIAKLGYESHDKLLLSAGQIQNQAVNLNKQTHEQKISSVTQESYPAAAYEQIIPLANRGQHAFVSNHNLALNPHNAVRAGSESWAVDQAPALAQYTAQYAPQSMAGFQALNVMPVVSQQTPPSEKQKNMPQ